MKNLINNNSLAGKNYQKIIDIINSTEEGSYENLKAHIDGLFEIDGFFENFRGDNSIYTSENPHVGPLQDVGLVDEKGNFNYKKPKGATKYFNDLQDYSDR